MAYMCEYWIGLLTTTKNRPLSYVNITQITNVPCPYMWVTCNVHILHTQYIHVLSHGRLKPVKVKEIDFKKFSRRGGFLAVHLYRRRGFRHKITDLEFYNICVGAHIHTYTYSSINVHALTDATRIHVSSKRLLLLTIWLCLKMCHSEWSITAQQFP